MDGVEYDDLVSEQLEESSSAVKVRADSARKIQRARFEGGSVKTNAEMGEKHLKKYCKLSSECESVLENAYKNLGLSPRARSRIIKVARTIADMEVYEDIQAKHILEAIGYRQN